MQLGKDKKKSQDHRKKTDPFYNTKFWKEMRDFVWVRDEALCQECLRQGVLNPLRRGYNEGHVDHIVPRNRGGSDFDDNLELLCKRCHDSKSAKEKEY